MGWFGKTQAELDAEKAAADKAAEVKAAADKAVQQKLHIDPTHYREIVLPGRERRRSELQKQIEAQAKLDAEAKQKFTMDVDAAHKALKAAKQKGVKLEFSTDHEKLKARPVLDQRSTRQSRPEKTREQIRADYQSWVENNRAERQEMSALAAKKAAASRLTKEFKAKAWTETALKNMRNPASEYVQKGYSLWADRNKAAAEVRDRKKAAVAEVAPTPTPV